MTDSPTRRTDRRTRPAAPRRRSGATARPRRQLLARPLAFVRRLPDHSLLDQIVRGRAWIPLLGLLLAGIVAMQVEVLKLSAGMGRSLERGTALQSRNELLRASVAELSDDQRIERIAAQMGMVMATPTDVHFLAAQPTGQIGRALGNIHTPDATTFLAALPSANATASTGTASTTTATGLTSTSAPIATPTVAPATPVAPTMSVPSAAVPTTPVPATGAAPATTSGATASPSTATPVGGVSPTTTATGTGG